LPTPLTVAQALRRTIVEIKIAAVIFCISKYPKN
jgi:hypothetical protein